MVHRQPQQLPRLLVTRQDCREGDPTCDHDSDPATCSFRVGLCFRVTDPRLFPSCTPTEVSLWALTRPLLRRDPLAANALLGAVSSLPGATIGGKRGQDVSFTPALASLQCTSPATIVVPAGKRKQLNASASSPTGKRDGDRVTLGCLRR